jgi:hypothetical protein
MMLQRYLLPALLAPAMLLSTFALAVPLGLRDNGSDVDGEFAGGDEVDGFLRFGDAADERLVLNYAYAIEERRIDGAVRTGERPVPFTVDETRVIVFLTDYPIPEEARGDIAKIHELANAREFQGLELSFDSARRKPTWTGRLLLGPDAANQVFRRAAGKRFQLEDFRYRGNEISGEILVNRGLPLFDRMASALARSSPSRWNSICRSIGRRSPPIRWSAATPRLRRRRRFPVRDRRPQAQRLRQDSGSDGCEQRDPVPGAEPQQRRYTVALLNYLPPTEDKLRSSISKIVFYGDRAALVMQHPPAASEFIFEKEEGQWKLSQVRLAR